ncbi:MAG: SDR family NAD(P)-dependent oxidoreductase [Brevinematales bacterium]|jgi:uncharacterized oxidoreductase
MIMSGNTILITGGATGIGYALAVSFIAAGNEVIICGRRKEKLEEAQKNLPGLKVIRADVTDDKDRKSLFDHVFSNFKNFNVLVNNAGIQRDIDLKKGTEELLSGPDEIKINLESPIILTAMFTPVLLKARDPVIINVSSGLGFVPAVRMPVYCATKAALHSYTMSLRYQLKDNGVKVYELIPPGVDTELNPEGRAKRNYASAGVTSSEFAAAVMKGLLSDEQEIGYSFTENFKKASRQELDERFLAMNSRWK